MWTEAFHRPLRWSVVGWIAAGTALAATASVLSFRSVGPRDGYVYAAIAVMLALVATAVARGARRVTQVTLLVCAAQAGAMVGLVLELVYGVAPAKAAQLRALGFAPITGVTINLVLSATAFALFGWFLVRWVGLRRAGHRVDARHRNP